MPEASVPNCYHPNPLSPGQTCTASSAVSGTSSWSHCQNLSFSMMIPGLLWVRLCFPIKSLRDRGQLQACTGRRAVQGVYMFQALKEQPRLGKAGLRGPDTQPCSCPPGKQTDTYCRLTCQPAQVSYRPHLI